tara:strand:- start:7 stop:744 length:738 start_codon:yes stop_codon:yes gene_type:complete
MSLYFTSLAAKNGNLGRILGNYSKSGLELTGFPNLKFNDQPGHLVSADLTDCWSDKPIVRIPSQDLPAKNKSHDIKTLKGYWSGEEVEVSDLIHSGNGRLTGGKVVFGNQKQEVQILITPDQDITHTGNQLPYCSGEYGMKIRKTTGHNTKDLVAIKEQVRKMDPKPKIRLDCYVGHHLIGDDPEQPDDKRILTDLANHFLEFREKTHPDFAVFPTVYIQTRNDAGRVVLEKVVQDQELVIELSY